jgi:hypothetical protein
MSDKRKPKKNYIRFEFDWDKRFRCSALPFQKGDKVQTPTGQRGLVAAVGITGMHQIMYRVGRKSYWYGFQLDLIRSGGRP